MNEKRYTFNFTLDEMKKIRMALENEQYNREKSGDNKAAEYERLENHFSKRILDAMFPHHI